MDDTELVKMNSNLPLRPLPGNRLLFSVRTSVTLEEDAKARETCGSYDLRSQKTRGSALFFLVAPRKPNTYLKLAHR